MKWALVVYFFVSGSWQTAESLKQDGWYRTFYDNDENCLVAQHDFAKNTHSISDKIRATCEFQGYYR